MRPSEASDPIAAWKYDTIKDDKEKLNSYGDVVSPWICYQQGPYKVKDPYFSGGGQKVKDQGHIGPLE